MPKRATNEKTQNHCPKFDESACKAVKGSYREKKGASGGHVAKVRQEIEALKQNDKSNAEQVNGPLIKSKG